MRKTIFNMFISADTIPTITIIFRFKPALA